MVNGFSSKMSRTGHLNRCLNSTESRQFIVIITHHTTTSSFSLLLHTLPQIISRHFLLLRSRASMLELIPVITFAGLIDALPVNW